MKNLLHRLILFAFVFLIANSLVSAESISQFIIDKDNAFVVSIVKDHYPDDSIEVFISKTKFIKDDTLELMGASKLSIDFTGYVVFADMHPGENWGHECEYLLVSCDGQQKKVYKEHMPPIQIQDFAIYRKGLLDFGEIIWPHLTSNVFRAKTKENIRQQQTLTHHDKYAVIISGGGNALSNYVRYWNDCSAMYQTLINHGYAKSHIYVAMSDGTNPAYDLHIGTYEYMSSPLDLDGDNINDIQYAAYYDNIQLIFDSLSIKMTADDDLFVFVTDHGGTYGIDSSYIVLWGGGRLTDYDFKQMLVPISARTINVVMEQCYSGGFIDDLRSLENVVITTACSGNENSYALANFYYDEFVYHWLTAVNSSTPFNMYPYYMPMPTNLYADFDQNGYVTMDEAYRYATMMDTRNEHPLQESYPYCLAQSLTLNSLLDLCGGALLVDGYDLYMKDNIEDLGDEPNITTNYSWISDDIWFEENGERVNTLMSGQTYDVCVRVRNRGNDVSSDQATLFVHWAKAHIGGSWPWGWTDDYYYDCGGTNVRRGELFGEVSLPSIPSGASYIARIPWTTPESEEYSSCIEFTGDNLSELWHYCVLARIVDDQEQPDETMTNISLKDFVLNYNNVVSRNVTIMDLQDDNLSNPHLTGIVGITNPSPWNESGPYRLICNVYGENNWEQSVIVRLTFSDHFYYYQTHLKWYGCEEYNSEGCFNIGTQTYFDSIYFSYNDEQLYPIKLDVIYMDSYDPGEYPEFVISMELRDVGGTIVGGEMFRFQNERPDLANVARSPIFSNPRKAGNPADCIYDEMLSIDVYNLQGQHVMHYKGSEMSSLHLPKGSYILHVRYKNSSYQMKYIK